MRTLVLLLAAAGIAGCASYQTSDDDRGAVSRYARHPPPFIYGSVGYPYGYSSAPFFYPPPYPYAFPRPFAGTPRRFHHGAPAGQPPQAGKGSALANAVKPPHPNNP
jgi:hypothetical protein